jgi:hypothetical protein
LISWFAISGAACLLERIGSDSVIIERLSERTQGGSGYGMLR